LNKIKYHTAIPNLNGNESKYLQDCIEKGFVSTAGDYIPKFEKEIAKISGSKQSVALNSGTSALHMALIASKVENDDLVFCPSMTFIASANAIKYCHADPVFIDIETDTFCICPLAIENYISQECSFRKNVLIHIKTGRKLKAILVVSFLGNSAKFEQLKMICDKYNLKLIIDAAASIGLSPRSKPIVDFGDFITYSFNGNKTITCGGGGAIVSHDDLSIDYVRHLSSTARLGTEYIHDNVGYNYRITNIEAAVGLAQIERLQDFLTKKKFYYDFYQKNLRQLTMIPFDRELGSVHWFSAFIWTEQSKSTNEVISYLNQIGCDTRPLWTPVTESAPYKDALKGPLENTYRLFNKIVILPSSTTLKLEDLESITKQLNSFLSHD